MSDASVKASVPVRISGLAVEPFTGLPVVLLVDPVGGARVPIGIGCNEASAIATELQGIEVERPMTHHLMGALLEAAGARVERVEVHDLSAGTFYSRVMLRLADGTAVTRDARPSDALALALHVGAPVTVTASVIDEVVRLRLAQSWNDTVLPGPASTAGLSGEELVDAFADETSYKWKM
jgi:uncharacterized protein